MLDVEVLPDNVLSDILENLESEDPGDVAVLSAGEAFDRFLIWNGIMGYTGTIISAINGIRIAETTQALRAAKDIETVLRALDQHGHMGDHTLKLCYQAAKAGEFVKIRELVC